MSLALAHKRRTLALDSAAAVALASVAVAYTPGEALSSPANAKKHLLLQEAALDQDLERLSAIKGLAGRQALKREELLPKYQDFIQRYMESGLVMPNRVLVQVMVWLFDTEQFEDGLELADFAIEQGQQMPERFKRRDIQTFVADAVIDWAYAEYNAKRSPEPYLSNLLPRVDGEWDLTEQIPSKYHKLIGMRAMEAEEWKTALEHLERSTELYPKAGNDTRIEKCRKALARQETATNGAQ
ncbi:terminase [Pseudomonas sp. FW306-02-F02-AA]|uniref:Terminase n=1 Tax=Pseudomonas fluorescens TaxID=294 RepID=A0A0N9VNM6_PSEFL|nr:MULTISPECIES: phage terminase small subunit [Pseudomonas]ALH99535.1 terminase [Pseudomonas fluorescens]PMZ04629.1 terminase [Pseudomonas sp. FW306-02-F02-AB]PMZ07431.1 terminase [Pseudomonas sp. FW306-02-H06C]PMZ16647.1 terminase [Pseudomonas sp. FW306-02-F02-AA]PMZ19049.1 terminase [Pseudomonas sp. FW306-02-F08-AA]